MIGPAPVALRDGRTATVRLALPSDAEAITDFVNRVGREKHFVLRERATWTIEEERRTLAAADGRTGAFFVATIADRLSGVLNISRGAWPKNAHVAEFGMACLADCRRVGLGTALLNHALAWAREAGVRKVVLEVFSTNAPAIALYRKMGFEEEGRRYREFLIEGQLVDGVRMARWL